MPKREIKAGDRVRYTRMFLQSIAEGPTSPMWRAIGTCTEVQSGWLAHVKWDEGFKELPGKVNVFNLHVYQPGKVLHGDSLGWRD